MKPIDEMSDDELLAELLLRKKVKEDAEKPKLLQTPHLTGLINTCQSYIDDASAHGRVDEDTAHYVFEESMKALYGKDVFNWINKKLR